MFDTPHSYDWTEEKWIPVTLEKPCDHSLLAPKVDRCALCGKSGFDIYTERKKGDAYRYVGDKVYYGDGELQWIGFYSPINRLELMPSSVDLRVVTDLGEYVICRYKDPAYVLTLNGKTIQELQREHHPHLYNEDGTWKRD